MWAGHTVEEATIVGPELFWSIGPRGRGNWGAVATGVGTAKVSNSVLSESPVLGSNIPKTGKG